MILLSAENVVLRTNLQGSRPHPCCPHHSPVSGRPGSARRARARRTRSIIRVCGNPHRPTAGAAQPRTPRGPVATSPSPARSRCSHARSFTVAIKTRAGAAPFMRRSRPRRRSGSAPRPALAQLPRCLHAARTRTPVVRCFPNGASLRPSPPPHPHPFDHAARAATINPHSKIDSLWQGEGPEMDIEKK